MAIPKQRRAGQRGGSHLSNRAAYASGGGNKSGGCLGALLPMAAVGPVAVEVFRALG